jgi:hypothetical protein
MATSHTELVTFRRCPREWYYGYVLHREPLATPSAIQIGRRVDTAIKTAMLGGVPDLSLLEPKERALVTGHVWRWKGTIDVERVDIPFRVRIGSVEVAGELDAIGIERSTNRRVVVEGKTTSADIHPGSAYWKHITKVDPQATIYLRAAQELGLAEPFLIWDALYKPQQRKKANETDDAFTSRVLGEIAEDMPRYYQRAEIVRHDEEHAASARDIEGHVHLMQVTRMQLREAPRNVDACFKWGRECVYFAVCSGATTIDDPLRYKNKERKKWEKPVETKAAEEKRWF